MFLCVLTVTQKLKDKMIVCQFGGATLRVTSLEAQQCGSSDTHIGFAEISRSCMFTPCAYARCDTYSVPIMFRGFFGGGVRRSRARSTHTQCTRAFGSRTEHRLRRNGSRCHSELPVLRENRVQRWFLRRENRTSQLDGSDAWHL